MRSKFLRTLIGLLLCGLARGEAHEGIVRVDSGPIRGSGADTRDVSSWKGIPYAAPPVGRLRWRPPERPSPWEEVRDANSFGPACPQPDSPMSREAGPQDEDCLHLNVWAPSVDEPSKLPVMVWIHGGAYSIGSSAQPMYDGAALAAEGVVVVTFNYRLGPLGWLAHPALSRESHDGVSGNYGLLDQIAALEWVHRNIASFGGDPSRVTIFGESAGAMSVCRLMVCPRARGLFHGAIAQSGGVSGPDPHLRERWYGLDPAELSGRRLSWRLKCAEHEDEITALRALSPKDLLAAARPALGPYSKGDAFGPVVDGVLLPDDPYVLWADGRQADVPFLVGSTADEGSLLVPREAVPNAEVYRGFVRSTFGAETLALYPAASDADAPRALARLTTEAGFLAPARFLASCASRSTSGARLYRFTRVPPWAARAGIGAFHTVEIPYVFGTLGTTPGGDEVDRALSARLRAAWARFAGTGSPRIEGWAPYQEPRDEIFEIGDELRCVPHPRAEACDLFDRLRRKAAEGRR